jgi:hypothetical protein
VPIIGDAQGIAVKIIGTIPLAVTGTLLYGFVALRRKEDLASAGPF